MSLPYEKRKIKCKHSEVRLTERLLITKIEAAA